MKVLLTEKQIQERVKELGSQISHDFAGEEVLMVGILKGAFVFLADLMRHLDIPVKIDFVDLSSYGSSTESSGEVHIRKDLEHPIEGKNVLIVEDIVDTGITLKFISEIFQGRNPRTLKICTFLDKPDRRKVPVVSDYTGFTIPDYFIVGYGLDYAEQYRNLPMVCILDPDNIAGDPNK